MHKILEATSGSSAAPQFFLNQSSLPPLVQRLVSHPLEPSAFLLDKTPVVYLDLLVYARHFLLSRLDLLALLGDNLCNAMADSGSSSSPISERFPQLSPYDDDVYGLDPRDLHITLDSELHLCAQCKGLVAEGSSRGFERGKVREHHDGSIRSS